MTVGAIFAIVCSYNNLNRHWINTVWSVAVATTSHLFVWDLYYQAQKKRLQINLANMIKKDKKVTVIKTKNKTALNNI